MFFSGAHLMNERLIAGFFMPRSPKDHLGQDGREVDAFACERVHGFPTVGRIGLGGNDAIGFQATKAVGKNVAGNFFVGVQKFIKGVKIANHHVANNQKGPAVTEHFDGRIEGTPGAAKDDQFLFGHAIRGYDFYLQNASEVGRLASPRLLLAPGVCSIARGAKKAFFGHRMETKLEARR